MYRDGDSGLFFVLIKSVVNLVDFIVFTGEGLAGDRHHADGVFVYILIKVLGGKPVIARLQRHNPRLDVEIAQKLFPDDLDVAAGYHVWATGVLSDLLSSLPPIPF